MTRRRGRILWRQLGAAALLAGIAAGGAAAQQPAAPVTPATLRLSQVVARLPKVHFFAVAQTADGDPVMLRSSEGVTARIGSKILPVTLEAHDGIAIIFLVDISNSLQPRQFELVKRSLANWVGTLGAADRAAIVTFGARVRTVQDFTADKNRLTGIIQGLAPHDPQTRLYQGLVQAIDLSHRLDENLPPRRAIIVLTDGIDDQLGGAGRGEVIDKLGNDPVPIYGIGAARRRNPQVDQALKSFSELTRLSGGDFRRVDDANLDQQYRELHGIVDATMHFIAECRDCVADGAVAATRLTIVRAGTRFDSQGMPVQLFDGGGAISPPGAAPAAGATPAPGATPSPDGSTDTGESWWWRAFLDLVGKILEIDITVALTGVFGTIAVTTIAVKEIRARKAKREEKESSSGSQLVVVSAQLVVEFGTHRDRQRLRVFPLGKNDLKPYDVLFERTLTVGRDAASDICIGNDPEVSGKHCTLTPKGKSILVEDTKSRNGTRVNGVPITDFLHAESDSILGVGRTELRLRFLPAGAK
jgi:Mg-chelatase subunit ChlD